MPPQCSASLQTEVALKLDVQAIYRAEVRKQALAAPRVSRSIWMSTCPATVKHLERVMPKRLAYFGVPRPQWRPRRITNVIGCCLLEARCRNCPTVCFVNVNYLVGIIYAIFNGTNEMHRWKNRALDPLTQAA